MIYSEVHIEFLKSLFPHGQVIYGTISLHAVLERQLSVVSHWVITEVHSLGRVEVYNVAVTCGTFVCLFCLH